MGDPTATPDPAAPDTAAGTQPAPEQSGLSAAQIAALILLVQAQAAVRQRLTATAVRAAVTAFAGITNWWDDKQVTGAVDGALRVVQASQRQAARVTDAYITRAGTLMTGRAVRPAGTIDVTRLRRDITGRIARDLADGTIQPGYLVLGDTHTGASPQINDEVRMVIPDPGAGRRITPRSRPAPPSMPPAPAGPGTPGAGGGGGAAGPVQALRAGALAPITAYQRVADAYRYQVIGTATTEQQAAANALVRVAAVAQSDVTLAVREQWRASMGKIPGVTGYRRVLHPELSQTGPCGLCVVAADRTYHKQDLLPLHDRCVCEVLPVLGDMDPGAQLNASDLRSIYQAAGGTGGDVVRGGKRHSGALKKVRVALAEHGEMGPVLTDADQKFRGPTQVAKTLSTDPVIRLTTLLGAAQDRLGILRRRRAAGDQVERSLAWQQNRVAQLQAELDKART